MASQVCKSGAFCSANNDNNKVLPPVLNVETDRADRESCLISFSVAFKMVAAINVPLSFCITKKPVLQAI